MTQTTIPTVGQDDRAFRLDVPTLTARIAYYPEELKPHILWLAGYVREKCNRNLDLLLAEANELKIGFDKTTWSRVLWGKLQKDSQGELLPNPHVKITRLIEAITKLKEQDDLRELAGRVPFVITPTAQMMFDFIDKKRAPDRVNKFGMIVGNTGTQKTATLREFHRNHNHGSGVMIESPANGSLAVFITDFAEKYNCSRQANTERKNNTIHESIKPGNYIIVENVQRLYHERYDFNQPVFNYLQKLQDDKNCTIILTLTPVFANKLKGKMAQGYFEQFIGRAGGERDILTLEEYPSDEDVLAIAESFKLVDAKKHLPELAKMVREPGRVRVLFEALQEAKVQAKKRDLTINHIRAVRGED